MRQISELCKIKKQRVGALKCCDAFVQKSADEAAWDPFSFSFFGHLRKAADLIPREFEEIDCNPTVKVQDRRVQPYIRSQLFIALTSEIEDFLKSLMQIVIKKYPSKIGRRKIEVSDLVSKGYDSSINDAIDGYLNELFYKKPHEYKNELKKVLSIEDDEVLLDWEKLVEIKARRDVGIHNGWIKNHIYSRKVSEVGGHVAKEDFLGVGDTYFDESLKIASNIIQRLSDHCLTKFSEQAISE